MTCPSTLKWLLKKKASVRALAGDGSAGFWREEEEGDEIGGLHDQHLIIIFMRHGDGISCSESPVTFG